MQVNNTKNGKDSLSLMYQLSDIFGVVWFEMTDCNGSLTMINKELLWKARITFRRVANYDQLPNHGFVHELNNGVQLICRSYLRIREMFSLVRYNLNRMPSHKRENAKDPEVNTRFIRTATTGNKLGEKNWKYLPSVFFK